MSAANTSARNELSQINTRRLLQRAIRSTVENLETRRLFAAPTADPGGVYNVAEGSSILISGLGSSDDGQIVSYQWDTNYSVGRGFRPRFTGTKFNFTASDSGTRNIALRVTDNDGEQHMATTTINIADVAPTLSMSAPNNAAEGQSFNITWSYTDPGQSDAVTAWTVDWGDGQTSTYGGDVTGASHAYAEDGAYVIELTATQTDATTAITHNITIDNEAPQVTAATTTPAVDEGDTVSVTFSSPNRAATIEGWVLDWGDGNIDVLPANTSSYTHQYTDSGLFTATISALEPDGGTGSATVNFTVANIDPGVAITGVPASGDEGDAISVGSTVSDAGADDTHTYGWTVYRDGSHFQLPGNTVINDTTFSFTPTDNGSYVIRLTVLDDDGGSTTVNSSAIVVNNVDPTAIITGEPVGNIDEGTTVNLTATPSDAGDEDTFSYAWTVTKDGQAFTLPNGTTTDAANFSFIPRDNGTYIATVVVTDDDSGSVTVASAQIAVDNVAPVAGMTDTPVGQPDEGDTVHATATLSDAGEDDTHTYAWSVTKDGQNYDLTGVTTDAATFAFVPNDNGDYVISLTITDDDGDTDTVTSGTITVNNLPPIPEIAGDTTADEGDLVMLTSDLLDRGSADTHSYLWSVEKDGQPFDLTGLTVDEGTFGFVPNDNGTYVVTLQVTDDDGGVATVTHTITVANLAPAVQQDNVPQTGDEGSQITIDSTVTDAGEADVLTYGWTVYRDGQQFQLPGGTTLDGQSFTFTPTDNGNYVVRLTVLDDDGGSTTVNSDPISIANVDPSGVVSGEPVGNIDEGTTVNLTVAPADAGDEDTFTYAWSVTKDGQSYDFGNAATDQANFSFTPRDNGTFIATVVVTDDDGGTVSVASQSIIVDNVAPDASVIDGPVGNVDEGTAISHNAFYADPGFEDTFTLAWSVTKDGQPFVLPNDVATDEANFTFVPTDNGDYVISLTVTDDDGGTDTATSATITVDNVAPTGVLSGDDSTDEGSTVNYAVAVTDPGSADTHTYLWSVEKDGQNYDLTGITVDESTFAFVPNDNGAYVVSVVVTDDDGGTNTYTHNLTVDNVAPTPAITGAPANSDEGAAINLGSSVVDPGSTDTQSYAWSVTKNGVSTGDVSTISTFSFTPDDNAEYVVTLVTTDSDGATGTTTATITVDNVAPTGSIAGEPVGNINEGDQVDLTSTVADDGAADTHTYLWTITKDGQAYLPGVTLTNSTLSFTPRDNGTFVATLTVTDDDGADVVLTSQDIIVDNAAPVGSINGMPLSNIDEGTLVELTSTVLDVGSDDTHTYSWSVTKDGQPFALPNNTVIDGTGFSFTPTDNGDYVVTLVVTDDDGGTDTVTSATLTVDNVAPAPTITGNASVNEASSITLSVAANDVGAADTHTYLWSVTKDGQPYDLTGITVDGASFTFTPSRHGAYVVSVDVTDDDGATTTATHNLTVNNLPPAVTINGLPSGVRAEGYVFNVSASAVDPGGDNSFTYAWSVTKNGSPWVPLSNPATNQSTFSFEVTDNGTYRITAAVTDSGGATGTSTTSNLLITNALPNGVMNNVPQTPVDENSAITVDISADDPGSEDTLTYAWSVTKNGQPFTLPGGTTTNTASFTFTPTDNGTYIASVAITDDDGGVTTVGSGAITVQNVAPTATISGEPSQSELEGVLLQLLGDVEDASPLDTFTYAWTVTKDGQPYSLAGVTANTASLAFSPNDNGTYVATLVVTDDDGGTVSVNSQAMTIDNVAPTGVVTGASSADEGSTVNYSVAVTDPGTADTHTYLWSATKDGQAYDLTGVTVNASTFAFVPNDNGDYVVSVVVTDDDGGTNSYTHNLTVANVAPDVQQDNVPQTGEEGSSITIDSIVTDAGSADTLTYGWTVYKDGQSFSLPGGTTTDGQSFTFTPTDNGSYVVRLTVIDDDGGSTTVNASPIVVANVNPTGVISGEPNSTDEGQSISLSVAASDAGENDTFSYSWSVTKNGQAYALTGVTTDEANFTFTPNDNGTYIATVVITDNDGGSSSVASTAMSVDNVNPLANYDPIPTTGVEGTAISVASTSSDAGTADTFTYTWSVTKNGQAYDLTGVTTNASSFSFTPTDNGTYKIILNVVDDDGASDTFNGPDITVTNVAPTATVSGPATADEGDDITVTSSVVDAGSADTHSYAWTVTKDGQPFDLTGVTTDESSLTFTAIDDGEYVASVVITDDDGASVSADHTVEVANVAPSVSFVSAPTEGTEGSQIIVASDATDVEADTLTYGWTIRKDGTPIYPDGVVLDDAVLAFTPTDNGTYTLRLTVMDEDGGSTTINTSSFVVANVAPSVAITGAPANMDEGTTTSLGSTVTDPSADDENEGFSYLWTARQDGSVVATGEESSFDFTPSVHGTYEITLTVNDKDGGQTTTSATTITVDNVAPSDLEFGGIPESMNEGEDTTLTASVTDAPGDTHTYAWTILRNGQAFQTGEGEELVFDPNRRGTYEIEVIATDSAGATTSSTTTLSVENIAPVASVSVSNTPLLLGESANFLLNLSDIPPQQAFTVTWNFGDGSTPVVQSYTGNQTNVAQSHQYATAGTFTATVTVSDGIDTTTATTEVVVSRAAVRTSPFDSTKTALFVLGTTAADSITVEPSSTPGNYKVTMNGVVLGDTFNPTGRVIVTGGGGADGIVVTGGISAVVRDLGAASYVQTDSGNDIVIGSSGNDYISTGAGRDILIGNGGGDTLRGGTSEDVLVANVINWSSNNTSIKTALDTWAGSSTFAARVTALKATNLFGTAAISNDAVQDQLYGESQSDWFVLDSASDRIRDWQSTYDLSN